MIDAILYIESFTSLVTYLEANNPEILANTEKDEEGNYIKSPVIVGIARTPAEINGDKMLTYVRLTDKEATKWRGLPDVEILAETPFTGEGTSDKLYTDIENDSTKLTKYESVRDLSTKTYTDEDGNPYSVTPGFRFGVIAGV